MSRMGGMMDAVTPGGQQASDRIVANLNATADRNIELAGIEAQKMISQSQIDAAAKLQQARIESEQQLQQEAIDAQKGLTDAQIASQRKAEEAEAQKFREYQEFQSREALKREEFERGQREIEQARIDAIRREEAGLRAKQIEDQRTAWENTAATDAERRAAAGRLELSRAEFTALTSALQGEQFKSEVDREEFMAATQGIADGIAATNSAISEVARGAVMRTAKELATDESFKVVDDAMTPSGATGIGGLKSLIKYKAPEVLAADVAKRIATNIGTEAGRVLKVDGDVGRMMGDVVTSLMSSYTLEKAGDAEGAEMQRQRARELVGQIEEQSGNKITSYHVRTMVDSAVAGSVDMVDAYTQRELEGKAADDKVSGETKGERKAMQEAFRVLDHLDEVFDTAVPDAMSRSPVSLELSTSLWNAYQIEKDPNLTNAQRVEALKIQKEDILRLKNILLRETDRTTRIGTMKEEMKKLREGMVSDASAAAAQTMPVEAYGANQQAELERIAEMERR